MPQEVRVIHRYEKFFFTYGDGVAGIDISKLIRFHKIEREPATVTTVQPLSRFGATAFSECRSGRYYSRI